MPMRPLRNVIATLLLGYALTGAAATPTQVDINTADALQLAEVMDGVGPAKAEAIVEYRKAHGPFGSLDDLGLVKGIGQSTLERNRERLTVGKSAP